MFPSFSNNPSLFVKAITSHKQYGVFTLNPEGIVTNWGSGATAVQGYNEAEVLGTSFAELYEKEVNKPPGYFNEILSKSRSRGDFEEEGWRQRKDGAYYWSTITIEPIYEKDVLLAYSVISRDLTDRKLAAEISEISEASDAHRGLVLATSNITWVRAIDGQFTAPHLQWEHYTGQIWPEYEGLGWMKMHPVEERDKIKAFWSHIQTLDLAGLRHNWQALQSTSLMESLTLKTLVWSKIHQEYRHTITTVVPHFKEDGKVIEWLGNEKDAHKPTLIKNELKEAVDVKQLMLSSARIGLWQWSLESSKFELDSNTAVYLGINLENFKCSLDEVMAQVHPDDRVSLQVAFSQCVEGNKSLNVEFRVVWADDTIHHIAGRGNVEHDSQGRPVKLLGSYWDITDTKQVFEAQARAQLSEMKHKEQAVFVSTVCHEVRNPANNILGALDEILEVQKKFSEIQTAEQLKGFPIEEFINKVNQLRESVSVIENCVGHQCQVTERVVDISEIRANKMVIHPEVFLLNEVIKDLVKIYTLNDKEKMIRIKFKLEKRDVWIKTDKRRFTQILDYIFTYARNNTGGKGVIELDISALSETEKQIEYQITIQVGGLHISRERRFSVFQQYMPISHHDKDEYSSENYGLSISKGLTELLGGSFSIESGADMETSFCLKFNFEKGNKAQVSLAGSSHFFASIPKAENLKILIVEDNAINQKMLRRALEKRNYQCQVACNGQEAVDAYLEFRSDWIFMDIEMPIKNGFEATLDIREIEKNNMLSHVPIFALSAYVGAVYEEKALEVGMTGFIAKPFKPEQINRIIFEYFQGIESQRASKPEGYGMS